MNDSPLLHVSFNAPLKEGPAFPTVLPMLGCIAQHSSDSDPHLYLHGSSAARLFKLTENGDLPMSVCATLLDGYVLGLSAFHHSCNYRSAVLFGYGGLVTDEAELLFAVESITNNAVPQRWNNCRGTPTPTEITSTGVLKMRIETASVKDRTGGPNDERHDLKNPAVADKVWTGVVPTYLTFCEPVANETNHVKEVPEYLREWVDDANSMNEQRAVDAVGL